MTKQEQKKVGELIDYLFQMNEANIDWAKQYPFNISISIDKPNYSYLN